MYMYVGVGGGGGGVDEMAVAPVAGSVCCRGTVKGWYRAMPTLLHNVRRASLAKGAFLSRCVCVCMCVHVGETGILEMKFCVNCECLFEGGAQEKDGISGVSEKENKCNPV